MTSLSKSTIYKMIAEKKFPRQIQIGPQQVVWTKHAVQDWMNQKIQEAALCVNKAPCAPLNRSWAI
ncbi:helix-turn-helix transcriptional regulator [Prochlorococcus marinus]|uniref:Predicted transcriptional regulator n=1 Tax=Prochlorococcus marinus (strain MIT 9303) TaxID=59922 RepID=A2CBA2_PROM3|nr:AlpA family phage regulatory protein [Prochlorococcus marinus]ABM78762.1 Predicted transcriptional regulator [Prochlorococcus marinus str. MIT 9303]